MAEEGTLNSHKQKASDPDYFAYLAPRQEKVKGARQAQPGAEQEKVWP